MRERTTLEIADKLDYWTRSVMSIHNVPTLPKLCDCGEKAADMLRQQHAEIADLQRLQCDCVEEIHASGARQARCSSAQMMAFMRGTEKEIDELHRTIQVCEAIARATDGQDFVDYEQLNKSTDFELDAIQKEEKLHHQWDGDGERCERCGDKDWFAGPECKPAVKGHACRPEDRAMLATPAGQELVACAIKDLEAIEDNGLFRASAKRSTREWSKEESVEWALQAIMPGYVNVQDVVDSVHASRREYVEMAHEYRRAAAEIERLASALANKEEECRALGLESGNLTEKARHAGIAHLSDNEIESTAAEYIYEEDGWNRDRYYHGLNLIAFANAIGHLSVRAFLSLSGQYVTNDASRDAAIAAAVAAEREEHAAEIERLRAQVKRLRDALVGIVADDDVNGLRFTAAVLESIDCDDATISLAAVRALIDIRPEGSAGEEKR